ncbi:MAG: hypothetical protein OEV89_02810 [Desulfobulbaceae bacterium]|nr:hypothetical protein [Desulfobulbaceae bacterium]HIJ89766.1 hypothetical protein [Deltaproteobacteria bacterium]
MTQSLNALFSPETTPHFADLQTFRLLFDHLFFYALPDRSTPLSVKTEQQEMWTGYTPVSLSEEEQDRFLSMAHELKGHEAEFHRGLLASLAAGHGDRDEASAGSLASALRSGKNTAQTRKAPDEALWQAMLILKLAEMFRAEEREIAQGFMAISDKEAQLFAAIRGEETEAGGGDEEEEQTLRELTAATAMSGPTINLTRLAKAWGHLYTRDAKAGEIPLLITNHEELQGLLADTYETLTGKLPRQLVSLTLPTQEQSEEDASRMERFKAETRAFKEHFNQLLLGIAANGTISAARMTELQGAGNELNRAALPFLKNSPSEKTIRFYAYEGASLIDLFAELCGESRIPAETTTGLLAVLS